MAEKLEKASSPIKTMQPHPDLDKLLDSPDFNPDEWVWERKFDGVRCLYDPATQECYSRSGTLYKNFDFIKEQLNTLAMFLPKGVVFDGEMHGMTFKDATEQLFRKSDIDSSKLTYTIFDIVVPEYTLEERRKLLWSSVEEAVITLGTVYFSQVQIVSSFTLPKPFTKKGLLDKIRFLIHMEGFEGIVLKRKRSKYEQGTKSVKNWVKGLIAHTEDLTLTSVEEGKGKLAGCVGTFICGDYRIAAGKATHTQLKHWWEHQEDLPKVIEVSYKSTNGKTLRHPRFVRARYDKD